MSAYMTQNCQDPALSVLCLSILSCASCVCFMPCVFPVFLYYFHVLLGCHSELHPHLPSNTSWLFPSPTTPASLITQFVSLIGFSCVLLIPLVCFTCVWLSSSPSVI